MIWQAPSAVRRVLTWVYWPVLALALIVAMGWLIGAATGPRHAYNALGALGAFAFAGLVAWRLWLNTRSLGEGGGIPPAGRLLRVFLPLGALALTGLFVVAMGIVMIAVWWFVTFGEIEGIEAYQGVELGPVGPLGGLALLIGAAMCWPLIRLLTRRVARDTNSTSEDLHD